MILLSAIKKSYGSHPVLDIPEMSLDNSIYWLKGLNGSGKTTLMKIIAGLIPFQGDIRLDGEITLKKTRVAYLRAVNYAEAEPLLPAFVTGMDLVTLFSKTKQATANQAADLMEAFHVTTFIGQPVGTYSSGMLKKLSLILAFIGNPKLILLDEPLVTIDDTSVPIVNTLIETYHREKGVTFLLTSHQSFETAGLPIDRQLIVENKTVTQI